MSRQSEKGQTFKALHEGEPFLIPNPWDAGSAKVMEALGFKALTSTSSGFAFTLGRLDGQVTLDELVEHIRALDAAVALPVAVDVENGYGPRAEDAANAITRIAEAGAVGGSIEDWDPDGHRLYAREEAAERVAAACEARARLGFPFMLVARAENHIRGNPDLVDTIARLQAYEAAGADVLYAPGLYTAEEIRSVCAAVSRPVNVLGLPGMDVGEIFGAGAQRVSVGGSLTWTAVEGFAQAAERLLSDGDLSVLASSKRIRGWLSE